MHCTAALFYYSGKLALANFLRLKDLNNVGRKMNKFAAFAGGLLFGTAGLKILSSRDAKKVCVHTTAAVLRAKDCVMAAATSVKEGAEDIYADAKALNEKYAAEDAAAGRVCHPLQRRAGGRGTSSCRMP